MQVACRVLFVCFIAVASSAFGQPNTAPAGAGFGGQAGGSPFGPPLPGGQPGGGVAADFESLIDLIRSTVASETWAENGGGEAEIRPYVGGVYADAQGVLKRYEVSRQGSLADDLASATADLQELSRTAKRALDPSRVPTAADARVPNAQRFVSLGRLERELARRKASGEGVGPDVLTLAGLRRIQFVLLIDGDIVLAGPAGDWRIVGDGRIVADDTGEATVRLDDLLTMLRRRFGGSAGPLGCSIDPRPESLAAAQAYLNKSKDKPVSPRRREAWAEGLREAVGKQDIRVFGVDPESRAAGVLIEADHHMKLVGMGLVEGVPGVESYLDNLAKQRESAAQGGVLRWWFSMHYTAINQTPAGDAYELAGPGARVMSETELLDERGNRAAAAQNDPLAAEFASSFSKHFAPLCRKYPIYSELRNLFDLAMAVELMAGLSESRPGVWRPSLLVDERQLPVPAYRTPKVVDTVVNHREVNRRRFVAGVSGGVWADARSVIDAKRVATPRRGYGPLGEEPAVPPKELPAEAWWWNAP